MFFNKTSNTKSHKQHSTQLDASKPFLLIGKNSNNEYIYLSEKSLYQNILVTGTIGSGKTSSVMYPFLKQLLKYRNFNNYSKIGMLVLDVKGNFYKQVLEFATEFNRLDDIVVVDLNRNIKIQPS